MLHRYAYWARARGFKRYQRKRIADRAQRRRDLVLLCLLGGIGLDELTHGVGALQLRTALAADLGVTDRTLFTDAMALRSAIGGMVCPYCTGALESPVRARVIEERSTPTTRRRKPAPAADTYRPDLATAADSVAVAPRGNKTDGNQGD